MTPSRKATSVPAKGRATGRGIMLPEVESIMDLGDGGEVAGEEEADEGQEVEARQDHRCALVVARQPPESGEPGEGAFDGVFITEARIAFVTEEVLPPTK